MKHLLGLLLFLGCSVTAAPVIVFYFNEYPATKERAEEVSHTLSKPHGLAERLLEGLSNHPVAGVFSTYFGFLQVSNKNGQTTFPRKRSNPNLKIVVTNRVAPIMMFSNTISHWEIEKGTPAQVYNVSLKQDDETKLSYWNVKKTETPANNQISPLDSIIIIARPSDFYMPEGITLAKKDANLILPDMYIKHDINTTRNALYLLNLTSFFRPVDMLYKVDKKAVDIMVEEY
jgi:hypothetical protein